MNARFCSRLISLALLLLGSVAAARAQEKADGPVSLVIGYRARPESRAAFRSWLATKGAAQFARWKSDGVFADDQLLFGSFAATDTLDAVGILSFDHYTDLARWKEIERTFPGGLSAEALGWAAATSSNLADRIDHGAAARRNPAKAAYVIAFYDVLTDAAKYRDYAHGYTGPQMRGWIDAGVLTAFDLFVNQNPAGAPWGACLVLEYRDLAGLAAREEAKTKVRAQLDASDAAWLAWSKDKSAIRKETGLFIADAITLPAAP